MTRERFYEMQMAAIQALKADMEEHMKNPMVLNNMREQISNQYNVLCNLQTAWENGSFWTPENERKYAESYASIES